jgi:hypothetical protein
MCMKSKYGPGGEFDPDWLALLLGLFIQSLTFHPLRRRPPTGGPPPPPEPPGPDVQPPHDEPMPARSGWRPINQTKGRKRKKQETGPVPGPIPGPIPGPTGPPEPRHAGPPPDLRQQVTGSWATWQRQYFIIIVQLRN